MDKLLFTVELLSIMLHFVVMFQCLNGKKLPAEVAIMLKLAAGTDGSLGTSAPVSLLDWYDRGHELILVLERPVPAVDLFTYIQDNRGSLLEEEAKVSCWRSLVVVFESVSPFQRRISRKKRTITLRG